jgi:hypothetical protein
VVELCIPLNFCNANAGIYLDVTQYHWQPRHMDVQPVTLVEMISGHM